MSRFLRISAVAGFFAAAFPACSHAGVMLWQVTGMDGTRYAFASPRKGAAVGPLADRLPKAEAVWRMPGAYRSATAIMQWDVWQYLKAWLVVTGRAADEKSALPTYRDLTASGYISIGAIEMPEMTGNLER